MKLVKGKNDLQTLRPDIADEWHPTKNGALSPSDFTVGSKKEMWWLGKCGHIWKMTIQNRCRGIGCPVCASKIVEPGFNDFESNYPEIAKEWHPTKNGALKPSMVTPHSSKKVWWLDSNGREWIDSISHRVSGRKAPVKKRNGSLLGINDLQSKSPVIAAEWHPTKNGGLTPSDVSYGSERVVWWICPFGHEYQKSIYKRMRGNGCPTCNKERGTSYPEQVIAYYLSQTTNVLNRHIVDGFEVDVFLPELKCGIEYDGYAFHSSEKSKIKDERKTKHLSSIGIRLIRVIEDRTINEISVFGDQVRYNPKREYKDLPIVLETIYSLLGLNLNVAINLNDDYIKIYENFLSYEKQNSLAVKYPDIAKEWHPTLNGTLRPQYFSYSSSKKMWWKCSKCGHEWRTSISHRTTSNEGCPVCSGRTVKQGVNDLATVNPLITKDWHPTKNGFLTPNNVTANSGKSVWWLCHKCGYEWKTTILSRNQGAGCPGCSGRVLVKGKTDLLTMYPELAKEFLEEKNNIKAEDCFAGGAKKYWWKCSKCGHEWQASIANRAKGSGCHACWRKTVSAKLGKKIMLCETGQIFNSATEAGKYLGKKYGGSNILLCCNKKRETYLGYHWKFVE